MKQEIKIKKGIDIPLGGIPERRVVDARSIDCYAVKPPDVVGFTPRLCVAEGDEVAAGQPLTRTTRGCSFRRQSAARWKPSSVVKKEN